MDAFASNIRRISASLQSQVHAMETDESAAGEDRPNLIEE